VTELGTVLPGSRNFILSRQVELCLWRNQVIKLEKPKPLLNVSDYPRTYRPSGGWTVFLFLVAALVAIGGALGVWYFGTGHEVRSPKDAMMLVGVCSAFVLLGLWLILFLLRFRILLLADGIEVRGLIFARMLPRDEILGWKVVPGHNSPPVLVLVPRSEHGRPLKVMSIFKPDVAFEDWLKTLKNLDAEEARQSAEEIANDPEVGATPEERLAGLPRARRIAGALQIAAFSAMAWGAFYPRPYRAAILTLAVLPWVAVGIVWRSPGLYRIDERRNDVHPNVAVPFILPGFVLLLRMLFDLHVFEWQGAIWLSISVGVVLWFAALMADPALRARKGIALLLLLLTSAYGAGAGLEANALLDKNPETIYQAKVLAKNIESGRHTEYKLHLSPWGPKKETDMVSVRRKFYESVKPGESVCVALRPGALHVAWYAVRRCR
jgi:hypothetical protein